MRFSHLKLGMLTSMLNAQSANILGPDLPAHVHDPCIQMLSGAQKMNFLGGSFFTQRAANGGSDPSW